MSQSDMNVANATGAAVRADLNTHLDALVTLSSGSTAPSPTFANQWWADTTANILKRRNNANTAWISVMDIATGLIIGTDVQAFDADTLKADINDILTAGFAGTDDDEGTFSSGTYTPVYTGGNFKKIVHGAGGFTIAVPAETSTIVTLLTNASASGTVVTSGYDKVTGDTIDNTGTNKFMLYHTRANSLSHLHIVAMQ